MKYVYCTTMLYNIIVYDFLEYFFLTLHNLFNFKRCYAIICFNKYTTIILNCIMMINEIFLPLNFIFIFKIFLIYNT